MDTPNIDKFSGIIIKITNLITLSTNNSNPHEAIAARGKAEEFINKMLLSTKEQKPILIKSKQDTFCQGCYSGFYDSSPDCKQCYLSIVKNSK